MQAVLPWTLWTHTQPQSVVFRRGLPRSLDLARRFGRGQAARPISTLPKEFARRGLAHRDQCVNAARARDAKDAARLIKHQPHPLKSSRTSASELNPSIHPIFTAAPSPSVRLSALYLRRRLHFAFLGASSSIEIAFNRKLAQL
ncbi:hypothetical protein BU16DRAFT_210128 [Lophium mytilinum]|uniref:Uncharacterized protein n=1 Tax=Lophium mytilinum TaxID=390894 RepID=A0A6A6RAK3_9PEZI|nr:hypothetical protein BU16DRAFT_210128 [Lophium mytilinum]